MNVVFDLGGVVLRWKPDEIIAGVFADEEIRARVLREVIRHPDWLELDRGTLALDDAIDRAAARTGVPRDEIVSLMDRVPASLTPVPETLDLVRYVREKGNRLYVLSNMQQTHIEHLESAYSIWDLFEGMVISCRIQMVKPEPGIYRYLLDTYALSADETVFIDDMPANVEGARQVGIQAVRFENAGQCEGELRAIGCV